MQGNHTLRYAVHTGGRDPYAVTDDAFLPLLVAGLEARPVDRVDQAGAPEESPPPRRRSSRSPAPRYRRCDGSLTCRRRSSSRVFNPTGSSTTVTVAGGTGTLVDLRGRGDEPFDGELTLRPWGIQTIHLDAWTNGST